MLARSHTTAYRDCGDNSPSDTRRDRVRRAKSTPSNLAVQQLLVLPPVTRSDRLTEEERKNQARAAAARAFKNDLLRKGEVGLPYHGPLPSRRPSVVRFKTATSSNPEYDTFTFFENEHERCVLGSQGHISDEPLPHQPNNPTYISTAPSSYRRIRRSRSLWSLSHSKNSYSNGLTIPTRSNSVNNAVKPQRSLSFLRGGTDFLPSSLRNNYRPLHSFGTSPSQGQPKEDGIVPEKPRSLRMRVRRMSSSLMNSMKRAFIFGVEREKKETKVPPQHVMSHRPYFGTYGNLSDLGKDSNVPDNIVVSCVNSGVPTLRRVPSSIGLPSRSGSVRIVTPPKPTGTPLSTSGNTWTSSTTTSTLRSATGSKRLSIIRETTPKNDQDGDLRETSMYRNKALDAQRVYSAFLRVTRGKNSESNKETQQSEPENKDSGSLFENAHNISCSSFASTVKKASYSPKRDPQESVIEARCPSRKQTPVKQNQENIPPNKSPYEEKPIRTHITIGPRITLYPPPEQVTNKARDGQHERETVKSIRHTHSAFFPYNNCPIAAGSSPSPYRRALAMSPDAPSIYSRTTSGETPNPDLVFNKSSLAQISNARDIQGLREQFVQLGKKTSLASMNPNQDDLFFNHTTPPAPKNSPASYRTAYTRTDENIPLTKNSPGCRRLGEGENTIAEISTSPATTYNSFGVNFLARGRERRDPGISPIAKNANGAVTADSRQKYRVLTAKNLPEVEGQRQSENQALLGIDSNVEMSMNVRESRGSWGMTSGLKFLNRSPAPNNVTRIGKKGDKPHWSGNSALNTSAGAEAKGFPDRRVVIATHCKDNTAKQDPNEGLANEMLKPTAKFSFETNDDREYGLSGEGPQMKLETTFKPVPQQEYRNSSIASGIGAFL